VYELEITNEQILRGDTWKGIEFTVNTAGVDYTGATIKTQFRETPDDTPLLTKAIMPTVAVVGQIVFTVALTAAETKLLDKKNIQTDTQITTVAGDVITPVLIKFSIQKDTTQ